MNRKSIIYLAGLLLPLPLAVQAQVASFSIPSQTIEQNAQNVRIPIHLDTTQNVYAFSFSLEVTSSQLRLERISLTGTASAMVSQMDSRWSGGQQLNSRGRLYWGVILNDTNPTDDFLPAGNDILVANLVVDSRPDAEGETTIRFKDFPVDLSSTPVDPGGQNVVVGADGNVLSLSTTSGQITTVVPGSAVGPFKRGDCNQDGENLGSPTDALFYLNAVFGTGRAPQCRAACDFNGDGAVEGSPTDAVFYLTFNFLGGPAMPAPVSSCQTSSRAGDIAVGCENPAGCS